MIDLAEAEQFAMELDYAEKHGVAIEQISQRMPAATVEDAYRIQNTCVERKLAAGGSVRGHKFGLTSRAMQRAVTFMNPSLACC
ncbi:MAG: hypothetical protein JO134_18555 [Xanthobacteraceae bacterium]|nr:hypothetical protein [Xanthobacteraceae bacterium]